MLNSNYNSQTTGPTSKYLIFISIGNMYRTCVDRPYGMRYDISDLSVRTHAKVLGSNLSSPTPWELLDKVVLENAHQTSWNLLAVNN